MAAEATARCGKRFYRWGVPKPDRRTRLQKGWGVSSQVATTDTWPDREKDRYEAERRIAASFREFASESKRDAIAKAETETLRVKFAELAQQWRRDTKFLSSSDDKVLHPAYQSIIAMGPAALPLVLEELKLRRGHWFWALRFLSKGADPVPENANIEEAREAWLTWGRQRGHIS